MITITESRIVQKVNGLNIEKLSKAELDKEVHRQSTPIPSPNGGWDYKVSEVKPKTVYPYRVTVNGVEWNFSTLEKAVKFCSRPNKI